VKAPEIPADGGEGHTDNNVRGESQAVVGMGSFT